MPTASQMLAALIKKFGEGRPVTLTLSEIFEFGTKWPTRVEMDDDGTVTLSIEPDRFRDNDKLSD